MLRLSIVIPFLGTLKHLEDTLVSVLENRPAESEVLVVLNQAYADPYQLAGEVRFIEARRGAGLCECIDRGVAASKAPVVHVLSCGMEATAGWAEPALARFSDETVASVTPIIVDRFDTRRVLSAGLHFTAGGRVRRLGAKRLLERLDAGPAGPRGAELLVAFYRKAAFEAAGGLAGLEDEDVAGIDLALAFRDAGFRSVSEPKCLAAASREVLAGPGPWQEGVQRERLFLRWMPRKGSALAMVGHAALLALECLQCVLRPTTVCRLAGRAWASVHFDLHHRDSQTGRSSSASSETVPRPHFSTGAARENHRASTGCSS